ncbi:hypothetical protein AALO_G00255200, partial [Alosa alosa]
MPATTAVFGIAHHLTSVQVIWWSECRTGSRISDQTVHFQCAGDWCWWCYVHSARVCMCEYFLLSFIVCIKERWSACLHECL